MTIVLAAETPPLTADAGGVVRVGTTRVTLDTIVSAFQDGSTAEEIAEQYPSVTLAQVYAVIAYYLAHRVEVENYLMIRARQTGEARQANERLFSSVGVRSRLLARQAAQQGNS